MRIFSVLLLLLLINFFNAMAQPSPIFVDSKMLTTLFKSNNYFDTILQNKVKHNIQIIYTEINRNVHNVPSFKTHTYNVNEDNYFYPASTAKMPIAFLALQKLNELNIKGLNVNTELHIDSARPSQTKALCDLSALNKKATISNYIKKLFIVSNNDANNRLYEFLGQEYINNSMQKMGYEKAQILHKLGVAMEDEQHRYTNPLIFKDKKGKLIYTQPEVKSNLQYIKRANFLGKGFYKNDSLINKPFDFSKKNNLPLAYLTDMLLSVIFAKNFSANKQFALTKSDYKFLYRYLSQMPTDNAYPIFDSTEKYDSYCKFLMYGSDPKIQIPKNIRIFNKIGVAYGFVTDVAYIVDFENKIEFALSATIHVNDDGIFNDDKYEYETIAYPFMKKLGEIIYEYELKREKAFKPNLKNMIFDYRK